MLTFLCIELFYGNLSQAWQILSSLPASCRTYLKPGTSAPVKTSTDEISHNQRGRSTLVEPSGMQRSEHMHVHPNSSGNDGKVNGFGRCMTSSFLSNNPNVVESGNNLRGNSEITTSMFSHSNKVSGGSLKNQTFHGVQQEQSAEVLADEIDDDDLLKVICFTLFALVIFELKIGYVHEIDLVLHLSPPVKLFLNLHFAFI